PRAPPARRGRPRPGHGAPARDGGGEGDGAGGGVISLCSPLRELSPTTSWSPLPRRRRRGLLVQQPQRRRLDPLLQGAHELGALQAGRDRLQVFEDDGPRIALEAV